MYDENTPQDEDVVDAEYDGGEEVEDDDAGEQAAGAAPGFEPFALVKERFTLSSINARSEKHGDDRVPALDLKFTATLSNSILLKLHPDLRDTFYVRDRQGDIEADYGRKLRFPLLGTIPYELEIPRVKLRVHDCDKDENDVILTDGTANKFKLTLMDGGSVGIAFRVQFSEYDTDALAALALVQQQVVPISMASEAADEPQTLEEQVEQLSHEPKSAARLAAEDMFNNLPDDPSDTDAVVAAMTGAAEAGEQAHDAGIEQAEQQESNVTPIKAPRKKRAAGGAE